MSVMDYANAIARIESAGSGDYAAVGPVTRKGNRAYGRYQVMDFNIGPWTEKYLGRRMTADEFLASPEAQDKVFAGEFGSYVQKYGNPQDAASAWFTGRPLSEGANRSDILGTTGSAYVDKFNRALGESIGADALRAIGKGPSANVTRATKQGDSMEPITQPQQRQGLLGGFFAPENRDNLNRLAIALEGMTLNPNQALIGQLQQDIESRETARQRNATADWLRSRGRDDLADALMAGASPQSVMAEAIRPVDVDANVQSSTALPDQSGVVLTMRDGSVQVRTVGGETLSGQAALDYVRDAQERSAAYQRSIYAARETGKIEAGAAAAAPGELALFNTLEFQVNDLLNDPYLPNMLGPVQGRLPNVSAEAARVQGKMNQLSGGAFLQARQLLKGGGAITDFESKKAEEAFLLMNTALNEEDFRTAMKNFLDAVRAGLPKLQAAAPGAGATGAAPAAPGQPTTRLRYNPATGAFE